MASNRDPLKSYRRRNRKTITSSSNRKARAKKSTVPKPTSSSTRASTKGSSSRVTTGQGGSRARVKVKPKSTGLIGTRNTPATKTTVTGPPGLGKVKFNPKNRVTPKSKGGNNIRGTATAVLAGALSSGKLRNPVSKAKKREAAKSIGKYNTRDKDGTVRNRVKVGPKKVGSKKVGTEAQNFEKTFAAARKAGKSTFSWKGKKYSTKLKK